MSTQKAVHTFIIKELRPVENPRTKKKDMACNIRVSKDMVEEALSLIDTSDLDAEVVDKLVPDSFKNPKNGQYYAGLWPVGALLDTLLDAPMPAVVTIADADLRLTDAGYDTKGGRDFFHIDYQAATGTVEEYDARKHGLSVRIRNKDAAAMTPVEAAAAAPVIEEVKAPF